MANSVTRRLAQRLYSLEFRENTTNPDIIMILLCDKNANIEGAPSPWTCFNISRLELSEDYDGLLDYIINKLIDFLDNHIQTLQTEAL